MRVLVTGGAGFIGSHLCTSLLARGDEVVVLDSFDDAYEPQSKRDNLRTLDVQLVEGDIRDPVAAARAVGGGVDLCVHLAARAGVRESLTQPLLYEDVNLRGTLVLLEALRGRCGRFVFASSSSVYGEHQPGRPSREGDETGLPLSPYAASKRACELFSCAWHQTSHTPVTCLRFFTVYGPRQRPTMAIARFIADALAGRPLPLFGDGASTRDYTWVEDVVSAICLAARGPGGFHVANVGSGRPISLAGLVGELERLLGRTLLREHLPVQGGDVPHTHADNSYARELFGWSPQMSIEGGLERTLWAAQAP